jgi:acetolactate synthase-1/3 small subunit
MKQIKGLINVIKLRDMTGQKAVKREMALICVKALPENQDDIKALIQEFNGTMIDEGNQHFIFEVCGNEDTIDILLEKLSPFGIKKLARSGVLALYREP